MNKDKIFDLFNEDNKVEIKDLSPSTVEDFMKTPYAKIGMFTKLILNHFVFHQKLQKFFEKEGTKFDAEKTKEASEFTIYNRAWAYIKQVNIEEESHIKCLKSFETKSFNKALQNAIWYFESTEEYEKCAHMWKIKKVVKAFENSLD